MGEQFTASFDGDLADEMHDYREQADLSKAEVLRALTREGLKHRQQRRQQFEQVILATTLAAVFAIPVALTIGQLWAMGVAAAYGISAVIGNIALWRTPIGK